MQAQVSNVYPNGDKSMVESAPPIYLVSVSIPRLGTWGIEECVLSHPFRELGRRIRSKVH